MGASDWQRVRQEARRRRAELLPGRGDAPGEEAINAAVQGCALRCRARPPADALLSGAQAVLDPEARTIWVRGDLPPNARRLVVAHELAHFWLHHEGGAQDTACRCGPEDFEEAEAQVGYGPRERREAEANAFAREFLLPTPLLRRWFWDEACSADAIAARMGLPTQSVLSQLTETLLPEPPETAPLPPTPLDESQQRAAHARCGPLLVVAGPGTGKTRTLAARMLYLTREQKERPETLLALTFSRRAANEMRERIAVQAPDVARHAFISTFHSYGLDLLRRYWDAAGLPPRPILLDPVDAFALLERHVATLGLKALRYLHDPAFPLPEILTVVSRAKEDLVTPDAFAAQAGVSGDERLLEAARVYARYQDLLREKGALDFGDLVMRPVQLLEERPDVKEAEQARWRHLLVDEYQDVNRAGARLVRLLASEEGAGLWAVGDLRQAIYAFRGASLANVAAFETDYPTGRRIELAVNYRSLPALVALFGAAGKEGASTWRPARDGDGTATLAEAEDDAAQADGIVLRMRRFVEEGFGLAEQVVLCRTRGQATAMRETLAARGIAVASGPEEEGGVTAADVKDLLSLLSRALEPEGPARHRIPDLPKGLPVYGDAWDFLVQALFGPPGWARRVVDRVAVARLLALARAFRDRISRIAEEDEDPRRAFLQQVRRVARLGGSSGRGGDDAGGSADSVRVLTIHAAKGLEFPVVFVPNLSQGKFPPRSRPPLLPPLLQGVDDEEARLFFVALTRARDHLVLSRAEKYNGRAAASSPLLACLKGVAELRHDIWKRADAPPGGRPPGDADEPVPARGKGPELEAWEAELYMRCPRRFYYERILQLPAGGSSAYAGFKRAVRNALRAPEDDADPMATLASCWAETGPDPAHPHAPLYHAAAEEIIGQSRARPRSPGDIHVLTVAMRNGSVSVRPDETDGPGRLERYTFRKPPKEGKVEPEERLSLLQEAALQEAAERYNTSGGEAIVRQRYLRTGEALPVPNKPGLRARHLAAYEAALRGVRLQRFPAAPSDEKDCPACPFFFICPA